MKKTLILIALVASIVSLHAAAPPHKYIRIITPKGECLLKLYDETPLHRDNFAKLVQEGYYKDLLFHRVIHHFMIQGGDPTSRYAAEKQLLGGGGPEYTVPAEFKDSLFHKKGVIAAARDDNPEKASSGSQFYLVQGRTFTDNGLDSLEQLRLSGRKIPAYQREIYKTLGGTPHLDQSYTVFGEVISGIAVIDSIAAVETDRYDRPVEDQRMDMVLLTRREALNLEREQAGLPPRNGIFTKFFDLFKPKY
ncbi:peptidylprolyl isomerase [Parapedobacter koreensis]|uniref:peptidylprolyl isomerase n=1 Tax=Parapedobacter koreensis TaxID=332977 RepID=A0A1H7T531_9SPHI|nr:peptidylprolyl isomerase [Parapedobacter koreensis]SEL79951.1 peptidyl-prolyl cis-trans isomerase B (cyclophilin B) [Parapedobacter koreensis]